MQLHSQTFAINIWQEPQSVNTLFPKRKQEVLQDKCHTNRISMTVYFSLNVYQSSHDTLYCVFNSDFQYKTLIFYCYFIRMLTYLTVILYLMWHNTIRCCFGFVCLFCCEVWVIVAKFYKLVVILTVQNDALEMTPKQKYHVTRNSQNWLLTAGIGACCYASSIARDLNADAYG